MIAITRKKTKKMAMIFIQRDIPLAPNKEAKVQDDLSSTTPIHVPILTRLQFKTVTWAVVLVSRSSVLIFHYVIFFLTTFRETSLFFKLFNKNAILPGLENSVSKATKLTFS